MLALAHLETWRPYTLGYAGLVSLAGAGLAGLTNGAAGALDPPGWRLAGAWAVPTLAWLAGLYGGDYFDRHLDAIAKPHRPIPSGRMPAWVGLAGLLICATAGAAIGAALNWRTVFIAGAAFVLGILYNTVFKARGLAGNVVRGALTALAFGFGTLATTSVPAAGLVLTAAVFWAHDAGSNIIGTLRDIDGDRAGGFRTLAVARGTRTANRAAAVCWTLWTVGATLTLAGVLVPRAEPARLLPAAALLVVAAVAGAAALLLVARAGSGVGDGAISQRKALRAHEILVVERLVLATGLVALGAGPWTAVAVGLPTLLVTLATQRTMRSRHEFGPAAATPSTDDPPPTAAEVERFVDTQLARLAERSTPLRALRGWARSIRIEVTDLPLTVLLVADGTGLSRVDRSAVPAGLTELEITTTAPVFRDVFLTGRSNPRRAYLTRGVHMAASPRDMLQLNQVFAEFRRSIDATATGPRSPRVPAARTAPRLESLPAAGPDASLPGIVVISDTTLRDGEQMPGVAFTPAEKLDLARRLDALGVPLIEAGFPAVSAREAEAVRRIVDEGLTAMIQAIARPRRADIDAAAATGVQSIALFAGTSDSHVFRKLRTTRAKLLDQVAEAVAHAKSTDRQVVFAAEDATRTDLSYLLEVFAAATEAGADALGVADTAGVAMPERFGALVAAVAAGTSQPIAVHCHDDLGLATANSLAGLRAGASGVQCSLLGIGERAGNAALEQVVLSLEIGYGLPTGIDLVALTALADHVARLVGQPVPVTRPVVGGHAFAHESGLHLDGILNDPASYEPYPPETVGQRRRFLFGKHSGRSAVRQVLDTHAVALAPAELAALLSQIKQRGEARDALDERAVVALARSIRGTEG